MYFESQESEILNVISCVKKACKYFVLIFHAHTVFLIPYKYSLYNFKFKNKLSTNN